MFTHLSFWTDPLAVFSLNLSSSRPTTVCVFLHVCVNVFFQPCINVFFQKTLELAAVFVHWFLEVKSCFQSCSKSSLITLTKLFSLEKEMQFNYSGFKKDWYQKFNFLIFKASYWAYWPVTSLVLSFLFFTIGWTT